MKDQQGIHGILWVRITGSRWQDMPRQYGPPTTAWRRRKQPEEKEMCAKMLQRLLDKGYDSGKLKMENVILDATTIEAKMGRGNLDRRA